ncbi:MAG: imidazolonepropionase [Azospirillaceae bacterium]
MTDDAWDTLWIDARLATMTAGGAAYGAIEDGAIAVAGDRIAWVGPRAELPDAAPATVVSAGGRWITPGLIDAHTHIVHGGDRAREFEMRLEDASYEEIARAGGGIRSTVAATRAADEDALVASALPRLDALLAEGVTTIEVKSGYGLDAETEARMLRAARRLGEERPVTVATTFLGAHALPPDYEGRPDAYLDSVIEDQLPAVAGTDLADAVDAFVERIAFSAEQIDRVFAAARARGLPVKLHADQLSDGGGAALAARHGALSADHVEYTSQAGVAAMAKAGTVAMLLPAAFYFLRETQAPPIAAFRKAGVPMALATDCNPGSAPATSLLLMLNMAATLFRLTPEEALAGVTRNAARALGMAAKRGTLEPGKTADFVLWDIEAPAELAYRIGFNPCAAVVRGGTVVRGEEALS